MGIVYQARQTTPSRIVGPEDDPDWSTGFRGRYQTFLCGSSGGCHARSRQHCSRFRGRQLRGTALLLDGYIEGESLSERVSRGPLTRATRQLIRDVAHARSLRAHAGIIHRDLKPADIAIDHDSRVRVTDFGLASRQSDETRLTHTGQLLGTPNFMPPEQIAGRAEDIGPAADVYSLGAHSMRYSPAAHRFKRPAWPTHSAKSRNKNQLRCGNWISRFPAIWKRSS